MDGLRDAVQHLENVLEKKRKGMPTAKQLHFLFREKISIPLTLTWGEASDHIDERINQIAYEKQAKQQALLDKFNGFAVKERVSHLFRLNNIVKTGTITKLFERGGEKYARVKLDDGGILPVTELSNLQRIKETVKEGGHA